MTDTELARLLHSLGCPSQKCEFMAAQLNRRARMDAERKQIAYEDALQHLLRLMAQGWAAAGRPLNSSLPGSQSR